MSADARLAALADELAWPGTPDLETAVLARLPATPPPARRRRWLLAVAVALLVPATALAVDRLWPASVEVVHVQRLPADLAAPGPADLGPVVSLAEAELRAGFRPLVARPPAAVRERGGVVTLVYDDGALLVSEQRGALDRVLVRKVLTTDNRVRPLAGGVFVSGPPHAYLYVAADGSVREGRPRLGGSTLIVQRGDLLVRIEGRGLSARGAAAIARALS